ncbi:MAG: trypsin-like peptidase domain-containing protein [Anaeromyxobacter sp.]
MRPLLLAVLAALATLPPRGAAAAEPRGPAGAGVLRQLDEALEGVVAKVAPAVVQIQVAAYGPEGGAGEGASVLARHRAIGSGLVVGADGWIVTNAHVVAGAQRIRVAIEGDPTARGAGRAPRLLPARIAGIEPEADVALLQIDAKGLPSVELSRRELRPGQLVFAVGSPQGLESTVTMGVVSSVARQPDPSRPMVYVQTDAPINPGNSGGPLVDTDGAVVGINTFILSRSGGSEGLGFAIPAPVVRFVVDELRRHGHVHHALVGLSAQGVTPALAAALGLPRSRGVIVADVAPGGPADAAGVRAGELLVSIDGRPMDGMSDLGKALYLHRAERPFALVLEREGRQRSLSIQGVERPHAEDLVGGGLDLARAGVPALGVVGVTLDDGVRGLLPALREPSGVVVVARTADGAEAATELKPGDVIHAVGTRPVRSVEELRLALSALPGGSTGVLRYEREGQLGWLEFDLD